MKRLMYGGLLLMMMLFLQCGEPFEFELLKPEEQEHVKKSLEPLNTKLTFAQFTQEVECQSCEMARTLMAEVSHLSPQVDMNVYDFKKDEKVASKYGVDKIPATVLLKNGQDTNIRIFGVPSGYEFMPFLETLLMVSENKTELEQSTIDALLKIDEDVHLQVLVTPT